MEAGAKPGVEKTASKTSLVPDKQETSAPLCSQGCPCLPDNWKLSPCALLWLIVYAVAMTTFMAGFIAPYWRENDDVTHSGLWKICAFDICYNFVGDSRIPKDGNFLS